MSARTRMLDALYRSRFYPHIYFFRNPFKTLEFRALLDGVDFKPGDVALDVGSGLGLQTNILGRHVARIVGIDPSENAVNRAKSEQHLVEGRIRSEFRCATIEEARFPDASFDKVFSICVLEHIPDFRSVLRECHRVLKPGGQLAFSVDSLATIADAAIVEQHRQRYAVCRYFEADELRREFEAAGFHEVRIRPLAVSRLAARWFADGVRRDFAYRYSEAWWRAKVLGFAEALAADRSKGIYLIVHARKP